MVFEIFSMPFAFDGDAASKSQRIESVRGPLTTFGALLQLRVTGQSINEWSITCPRVQTPTAIA